MLKKTIAYKDFNGNDRNEEFWFHMSEAELAEMQLSVNGGMESLMRQIINTRDTARLIKIFKDLVLNSYGEKSLDGRLFQKSPELSRAFSQTPAYSILFMELATDADKAAEFLNGIVPDSIKAKVQEGMKQAPKELDGPTTPSLLSSTSIQPV